jgi:hypothetical protein
MDRLDFAVTDARVACLKQLLSEPATYTQRFVEKLSFLPSGGQQWERDLQIQIPADASQDASNWWIIPLGEYTRARLADFLVTDAGGRRLNLVTRRQHGDALTGIVTSSFVPSSISTDVKDTDLPDLVNTFRRDLFTFFTSLRLPSDDDDSALDSSKSLESAYHELLTKLNLDSDARDKLLADFNEAFTPWVRATQYLCWVKARPGEVVGLRTDYSLADPKQHDTQSVLDEVRNGLARLIDVRQEPEPQQRLAAWYREFGLGPIDYSFKAPKRPTAPNSYYFILHPPPSTEVTYLDWEEDWWIMAEERATEVKCAYPAAHIHQSIASSTPSTKAENTYINIRAYLRCAPYRHKQILGAVALNLAVVFLLSNGSLPTDLGEPLQGLIIAAPSVVIGYLVQQQRHYYSDVIRRQRGVLWIYLAVSITFLLSVAFSERDGASKLHGFAAVAAWALAISSGAVLGWQFLLGSSYARNVGRIALKNCGAGEKPMREHYGAAVRKYGSRVRRAVILGVVGAVAGMALFWHPVNRAAQHSDVEHPGVVHEVRRSVRGDGDHRHMSAGHRTNAPTMPRSPSATHPTPAGSHQESRGPVGPLLLS